LIISAQIILVIDTEKKSIIWKTKDENDHIFYVCLNSK